MGRWANNKKNSADVTDAILDLNKNPDAALKRLADLAEKAAKHDRSDAAVMRDIVENHRHLAG